MARSKSPEERLALLKKKREQLDARMSLIVARQKKEDRKRDARRKIVVGAAVLAHAEHNPAFNAALIEALRSAVTRPVDLDVIADLLMVPRAPAPVAASKPLPPATPAPRAAPVAASPAAPPKPLAPPVAAASRPPVPLHPEQEKPSQGGIWSAAASILGRG